MIFWIAIAIIVVLIVGGIILAAPNKFNGNYYWDGEFIGIGVIFAIFFAAIATVVIGLNAVTNPVETARLDHTWELRALVTQSATEGHAEATFFLGFGYASSDTTNVTSISYIRTAEDGGSTLQKADIEHSVIYEDGAKRPYVEDWVTVKHYDVSHFWVPWDLWSVDSDTPQHRFHIPEGSILQSYEVKP